MLLLGPSGLTYRLAALQTLASRTSEEVGRPCFMEPTQHVITTFCSPWSTSQFINTLQLRGLTLPVSPRMKTDILSAHWLTILTILQEMKDFTACKCFLVYSYLPDS